MRTITKRLLNVIPGGAHTYSRGYDQYPSNAPEILSRGKGAYVYDNQGSSLLDYGMALRSVGIGYANDEVNQAAIEQISYGNNLTRPSEIELMAAEALVEHFGNIDMVKFTKNGSTAVSAAVKLARAYTGKKGILVCGDHPFFSYDDWFIGSTPVKRGIPEEVRQFTRKFRYNDIESLECLIDENNDIACVVMEPANSVHPCASKLTKGGNFLNDVELLCRRNGIIFVLDEMITGFRWDLYGAQRLYNVTPDITTLGKCMANGFSVAAVAGKREIMELGSIEKPGRERVFLLSTTHGAEMSSLGAFVSTLNFYRKNDVVEKNKMFGQKLLSSCNDVIRNAGLQDYLEFKGVEASPGFVTKDGSKDISLAFRTLFIQEMLNGGVLMPWVSLSYAHGEKELSLTLEALSKTLEVYSKALESGPEKFLEGDVIKPVFRKYN